MSNNTYKPWLYSFVLLSVLVFTACSPIIKPDQPEYTSHVQLSNEDTYGQTLLAKYDGLSGVLIHLKPSSKNKEGTITLNIFNNANNSTKVLAQGKLSVSEITSPDYYHFKFPTLNKSAANDYYFEFELDGVDQIGLGSSVGDSYIDGSLYHNGSPIDAQLGFKLVYDPIPMYWGLFMEITGWAWLMILSVWLFIIPGWAILSITIQNWDDIRWSTKLGLSIGVSVALYPLILLWTNLLGMKLGAIYAWLPPLMGLFIIIRRNRSKLVSILAEDNRANIFFDHIRSNISILKSPTDWLPDILLVFVLLLIAFVRFWAMRNLDAPMWGDSYQHTMIAQLMVDNGGLFENWEPYVPYYSLTVHFGFHSAAALLAWLTGTDIAVTTLQTGQIFNTFAIITLLPLADRFNPQNRWSGLGVALVAGLLSQIPAFYVNWGRYPQLAGQVILPVALWFLWETIGTIKPSKFINFTARTILLIIFTALIVSGMILNYYRMGFYFASFTIAWLLIWGTLHWKLFFNAWIEAIIKLTAIAVTSLIIILPWIPRLMGSTLSGVVQAGVSEGSAWAPILADYKIWSELGVYTPYLVLLASIIALSWSIYRKQLTLFILPLWFVLLTGYITGKLIGLPGANMIQNFTIIISIYIPLGLLTGWLVDEFSRSCEIHLKHLGIYLSASLMLLLAIWGARELKTIPDPNTYALVTRPDMRAMSWINKNIPDDARFLVEGYRIYGGWTAVGSDAGWWIPLLTNNENSMPPQYALMNEIPSPPDYSQRIVDLVASIEDISLDSEEGTQILCDNKISHIYIGQGQGKTGFGSQQLYTPKEVENNPAIELIYRQDRVYIFKLKQEACEQAL